MEDHSRLKINPRDRQFLGAPATVTTRARQSLTLDDRLRPRKPNLSYADLHCEITRNIEDISPKHSENFLKHFGNAKEEELVRYMSKLPSYLERGEKRQEKVLNVGVLDWGRLEKWQYSQKHILHRNRRNSLSSTNSSSSLSTEGSSVDSSRGKSRSPAHQKTCRPLLQSHLISSPVDVHPKEVKSLGENFQKGYNVEDAETSTINVQGQFIRTGHHFSKNCSELRVDHCSGKEQGLKINVESGTFDGESLEALQSMQVMNNTRDGKISKRVNNLREQKAHAVEQRVPEKCKRITLLMPRDLTQGEHSLLSEATTISSQKAEEPSRRSFSEMPDDINPAVVSSDIPHSCPLPCGTGECKETKCCSSDSESVNVLPNSSHSVPYLPRTGGNPSHGRIFGTKRTITTTKSLASKEPPAGLDRKLSKAAAETPRSTSPFRRLSIGMGKIGKSFSSKDSSAMPPSITTHNSLKFPSENDKAASCQGTFCDMQSATSRARSSPLRRLLEPLLKTKAPNCHQFAEPLQKDAVAKDRACRLSNGRRDSLTGSRQPRIVKFDMASCREVKIENPSQEKKQGSSAFQALLQVAIKNGQPFFTFAVDNECSILAATVKKLSSSRDDDCSCVYTFFAIREVKNKIGRWINQGGKDKGHDYIPNVVAQLKVFSSQFSSMTRENYVDRSFAREFVLFAVDLQQSEQPTLDFQPNNELAAIVVKVPKVINRSTAIDRYWTGKSNDFLDPRLNSSSREEPVTNSQSIISATVILPSGVHTLPNKGGPSSLIQRWRSGGSCDCGGWDLGCKLRIFANQNKPIKKSSTSKVCSIADKFELIPQCGEEEEPVFSLVPFKDGIYSVEFTSPLSILQAFSLCIAVLDSRKLCDISESSNLSEEKTSLRTILAQNDGIRAPNGSEGNVPARYVSYPPLSPVGRV